MYGANGILYEINEYQSLLSPMYGANYLSQKVVQKLTLLSPMYGANVKRVFRFKQI